MFTLYPAIDLRNGSVVRLKQGDPNQQTTYGNDPLETALRWQAEGAAWLHVVNLDGAFEAGEAAQANRHALANIARRVSIPLQFGGGLRTLSDVQTAFDAGVTRVVLGTAAIENPQLVEQVIKKFGAEHLVVGLDARAGMIVTRGWQETTPVTAIELGERMKLLGVVHALHTEVMRDGMMTGAAAEYSSAIAQATDLSVIASGGVGKLADIEELLLYAPRGVAGVVVGRALYEGTVNLREALARCAALPGKN